MSQSARPSPDPGSWTPDPHDQRVRGPPLIQDVSPLRLDYHSTAYDYLNRLWWRWHWKNDMGKSETRRMRRSGRWHRYVRGGRGSQGRGMGGTPLEVKLINVVRKKERNCVACVLMESSCHLFLSRLVCWSLKTTKHVVAQDKVKATAFFCVSARVSLCRNSTARTFLSLQACLLYVVCVLPLWNWNKNAWLRANSRVWLFFFSLVLSLHGFIIKPQT